MYTLFECIYHDPYILVFFFVGLKYIRKRLSDDNVIEKENDINKTETTDEEVSAKRFFKTKRNDQKDVVQTYLSPDNDDFDIFKERCEPLKNLAMKLNTLLPASAACERLFSTGGLILRPHRTCLSGSHFEACLLTKLEQ